MQVLLGKVSSTEVETGKSEKMIADARDVSEVTKILPWKKG